jgi:hypothetical protein
MLLLHCEKRSFLYSVFVPPVTRKARGVNVRLSCDENIEQFSEVEGSSHRLTIQQKMYGAGPCCLQESPPKAEGFRQTNRSGTDHCIVS